MMATDIVEAILNELRGRKGFDWWWDDLEEDIKQEIRESLIHITNLKLDGH